jgi:hypothetical protein
MGIGKLTGLLMLLLASFPLHAQSHAKICNSIGQTDVAIDICRANLQQWEDSYRRDLEAAARHAGDPQQFMRESTQALDREIFQCQDSECIRIVYADEIQRLQTIERGTDEAAAAWTPPTGNDREDSDGGHFPGAATSQSTSTDEVPTWQPSESAIADPPAPDETSSPASTSTHPFGQTGAEARTPDSIAGGKSAEKPQTRSIIDQLAVLSLWAALGCVLLLMLLAATNHVVVFYDGLDVWWSFAPLLSLATGYMIARSISSEDVGTSFLEILVMGVAILVATVSTLINYHNSIRHNRSMILGLAIGTLKLAAASFTVLSVAGQLSRLSDSGSTRRERTDAMLILAVIGFVWWVLVNGQRVYEKRGWQPLPTT